MSLYNMINGVDQATFFILPMLGKHPDKYPRFRDCFIEHTEQVPGGELGVTNESVERKDGEYFIYIYTRVGGGNREYYDKEIKKLQNNKHYISDKDDDFDCTFATFKFKVPKRFRKDFDIIVEEKPLSTLGNEYKKRIIKMFPKIKDELEKVLYNHKGDRQ